MTIKYKGALASVLLAALFLAGCKSAGDGNSNQPAQNVSANANVARTTPTPAEANADADADDDMIASGTGVEKEKPAAGTGNVQGKVTYNDKPAEGIEVKLCKSFNQFLGGCGGETFRAKTDSAGEYVIKNVPPGIYEALTARVFNTDYYVFATSGIIQSAKYKIEDGKTFFAPETHLFKQDLKLLNPKAGSKIEPSNIEVKWDSYPDAAYYKFSIYADSSTGTQTEYDYIDKRVDGQSFVLDKPLAPGTYTCKVEAYNDNDTKLARSSDDIKFTVKGDAAK